jgi:hypothetical protein
MVLFGCPKAFESSPRPIWDNNAVLNSESRIVPLNDIILPATVGLGATGEA